MKKIIAVTQKVTVVESYKERHDAIDQRWTNFLLECDILPVLLSNNFNVSYQLLQIIPICGILLTGGNDLCIYGGDAPERDQTEKALLEYALDKKIPLFGICRGMQVIQDYYGIKLNRIKGHVTSEQTIIAEGEAKKVNSYHRWGTTQTGKPLQVWAKAKDGVVKAVKHENGLVQGIMWHPERFASFHDTDKKLFNSFFR